MRAGTGKEKDLKASRLRPQRTNLVPESGKMWGASCVVGVEDAVDPATDETDAGLVCSVILASEVSDN